MQLPDQFAIKCKSRKKAMMLISVTHETYNFDSFRVCAFGEDLCGLDFLKAFRKNSLVIQPLDSRDEM